MVTQVPPVIEARGLRFAWPGQARPCLDVAQLSVSAGEAVFVHGPSGGGKSTLLSLLCGVLVADAGEVSLRGQDWRALPPARRDAWRAAHAGYIFQQFNLLPYLSAIDNVLLPCWLSPQRRAQASVAGSPRAQAQTLLGEFDLGEDLWVRPATELSVGQQQRVAAARALMGRPSVVIADEPTSSLDDATRDRFMAVLSASCRRTGAAIVFVSHDLRLAPSFDRVIDLSSINRAVTSPQAVAS